jgi:hypothetical protein
MAALEGVGTPSSGGKLTSATVDGEATRFPISFDPWYRVLSSVLGLPPSGAYVQVGRDQVHRLLGGRGKVLGAG